jgi:hypothetical protein
MTQPVPSADAQKAAALEVFAQYEPPLYEAYLTMMLEWLAAVKAAMFTGGIATLGLVPDPIAVFSQTPKWTAVVAEYTAEVAREVLAAPYKGLLADDRVFESRPFVRNWIAQRENRLNRVPDEVFGLVSQIIDSATVNGASIPDVTAQVEELFADTGTPNWQARARTVARTEVVGAYNGGLHDAFAMIVDNDPGTEWVHRWLATDDHRTRPDHREADGQVQPFHTPFTVGARDGEDPHPGFQMMYPHDPAGPAHEVINCRCVELLEIKNEPTRMDDRQTRRPSALAAGATLMQSVCDDGSFCMQTHKPGLCKGQKRGQTEPGSGDATTRTPAQVAKTAVTGLSQAIAQAQAVVSANPGNPKLAAMARKAIQGYKKALGPHQQKLKEAAGENAKTKTATDRDTREQDDIDTRATKKAAREKERLGKAADRITSRRAEKAKLAKMSPKQRTAYHKAKAAKAAARRKAQEDKTLKQAGR